MHLNYGLVPLKEEVEHISATTVKKLSGALLSVRYHGKVFIYISGHLADAFVQSDLQ